jgi:hypothetical protein
MEDEKNSRIVFLLLPLVNFVSFVDISSSKPADLPVETAEVSLVPNLKTSEEIGIKIPHEVLVQAHVIHR